MNHVRAYTEEVLKHFRNPKNFGRIEDADGIGKVGNPICGDSMYLYIKVKKNKEGKEIIEDIKFETFGCAAAIATSSKITEMVKGKSIEEAKKITMQDVDSALGGLPPIKKHCSNLSAKALAKAIEDYEKKKYLNK